jgi:hypothetical protein
MLSTRLKPSLLSENRFREDKQALSAQTRTRQQVFLLIALQFCYESCLVISTDNR